VLLGALFWAGCGGEVRTYRIAPHLGLGYTCVMCSLSLAMQAQRVGGNGEYGALYFTPEQFVRQGFTFQWGTEQLVEIEVERYDPGDVQDDPGTRYTFRRVLESRPVAPGSRFELRFHKGPPGHYPEDMLVREGDGVRLGRAVLLMCDSAELCEQLVTRQPGEEEFVLELSYPETEGGPLRLHSLQ